ncbi:hypothetical protein BCR35DRAFT_156736 [Leucosporidium creatinivorum]|uniref:PHD-type domain-containing protein n=1 Tax=Leucosporidium creatinivorum TaxID=106004 RepID=A0A1Y2FZW7_9BASI|nr:hypothetical protein BCR35DRAFT_156736 [Leucosporidium creatinivorum]
MTAPKKKGKTGRASATNSPALHSAAFPPLDDEEEQAYLFKMEENDTDGDYTAGGAGKPKKPASGSKKPVSSSSTSGAAGKQQAPVNGGGASKYAAGAKEKGKETKRSGSMKIEDSEEALFTTEKRGARGRAGSSKKVVEEVEEEEEEPVEEEVEEEEDDGVTRCVCDEDNDDLSSGLMIECDTCKCWQHGPCVGLWNEKDCPDRYFCELCRPSWHGPGGILRKAHRKNAGPPPPPAGHRRSPSVTSTSHAPSQARNKPRESADAALVSAFLAGEQHHPAASHDRERDSQSPSPPPAKSKKDEPVAKKRSTMNSRDAAYDDAIAMSILGPGSAAMRARLAKSSRGGDGSGASASGAEDEEEDDERPNKSRRSRSGDSPGADDEHGSKRRRLSVDGEVEDQIEVEEPEETLEDARREYEANEARRQAEAEAEAAEREPSLPPPPAPTAPARAKHPNQYTYRPKNGAGGTSRPGRASPVKRSTKDSASSKGDSAYNGGGGSTSGGAAFLGGVVENLIRSQRPRDWTPQEGGWGMPDHLKHLSHLLPTPTPTPLVVPAPTTYSMSAQGVEQLYEQPTKVRFPNKRMTMPEMKKRARNVLEYLGRVEVEMSERAERRALLKKAGEMQERERRREAGEDVGDEPMDESGGEGEKREESETVKAMDALTRELHEFQRKFWGEVE